MLHSMLRIGGLLIFPVIFSVVTRADSIAFMTTGTEQFGTVDLNTGVFSQLGTTQAGGTNVLLSGLGVANGALYGGITGGSTLYQVNTATGTLTSVGNGAITYSDTGSTTSGLYALDLSFNLYSINPLNGFATLIGPTGLPSATAGLSTNSSTLYFTDGSNLYTLNTTTGAPTLIGNTGVTGGFGALVFEDGVLWGGENHPNFAVTTLNTSTGSSSFVASVSGGAAGLFWGLAPAGSNVIPEPVRVSYLIPVIALFVGLLRRGRSVVPPSE